MPPYTKSRSPVPVKRSRPNRTRPTPLTLFSAAANGGIPPTASEASSPIPASDRNVKHAAELIGIARLAASSPLARQKCGTEYFVLPVRSILNRCDSERVPFRWTVNPYRGCEFGCHYCYARYTHEYMDLDGGDFERKIFVKDKAHEYVESDLARKGIRDEHIAIGTATDPYQPAEREFGVTRSILERMAKVGGLSLSITTKSNRVARDIDLLRRIAERSTLFVNMTIVTLRTRLARMLEPRAPRPDLRLEAIERLRESGIAAGINMMPIMPGINDGEDDTDALARAAKLAGAQWFAMGVLFLMPSSRKQFLPFIERRFPRLNRQYRDWYGRNAYPPESYRMEISRRATMLREKYGLGTRPAVAARPAGEQSQLAFSLGENCRQASL